MALFLVELDERLCWHLAAALKAHTGRLRSEGLPAVPVLADLGAAMARLAARSGHDVPDPAVFAAMVQDRAMPPLLLTLPQAARALGLGERTLRRLVRSGEVPSVKVGSRVLVRHRDLEAYADGLAPGGRFEHKGVA